MTAHAGSPAFTHYWMAWAAVTFLSFIIPEVWALFTNVHNTLSDNVWRMEQFLPGSGVGIASWSVLHFLFIGMLLLMDVWLLGHFGWGLWR